MLAKSYKHNNSIVRQLSFSLSTYEESKYREFQLKSLIHPLPIYRTTSKTSKKLMRYRHVPKLFQALSVYGVASNLLTGSFIMAGLWTLPGLLAFQIARNISANAKAIVKSVNLLPFGMIVEVENLEGGRKQYAIKHLRAPSEREVEAIIRGGQEAAEAMIKANTPIIVEPKAGLIVDLLYIDEKNNEFNDDAVKQEMLGCVKYCPVVSLSDKRPWILGKYHMRSKLQIR